jgi:hypothetical protein
MGEFGNAGLLREKRQFVNGAIWGTEAGACFGRVVGAACGLGLLADCNAAFEERAVRADHMPPKVPTDSTVARAKNSLSAAGVLGVAHIGQL